jgi:hypothetical protein
MSRWYSNRAVTRGNSNRVVVVQPVKKPRATNAQDLFAKSHQEELRAAVSSKMKQDGSTAPGTSLVVYRDAKQVAYSDLSEAERLKWETLAKEHNDKIKAPPSMDYIYEYVFHLFLRLLVLISP